MARWSEARVAWWCIGACGLLINAAIYFAWVTR